MSTDSARTTILLVFPEAEDWTDLMESLRDANYKVERALSATLALQLLSHSRPSAVVLDLGIDDMSVVDFVTQVRQETPIPILLVHQESTVELALDAVEAGADDYVCGTPKQGNTVAMREFHVRLDSALRVASRTSEQWDGELVFGDVRVDLATRQTYRQDTRLSLTRTEYQLLLAFMRNPEHIIASETLLDTVWGSAQRNQVQYVRVYVHRLRRLMGWDGDTGPRINTVRGVGYCLTNQ